MQDEFMLLCQRINTNLIKYCQISPCSNLLFCYCDKILYPKRLGKNPVFVYNTIPITAHHQRKSRQEHKAEAMETRCL